MECSLTLALTALISLHNIELFHQIHAGKRAAAAFADSLLNRSVAAIQTDPFRYRYNRILMRAGFWVREWLDVKYGYRCFYLTVSRQRATILLYASMKEDFVATLRRHNLLSHHIRAISIPADLRSFSPPCPAARRSGYPRRRLPCCSASRGWRNRYAAAPPR